MRASVLRWFVFFFSKILFRVVKVFQKKVSFITYSFYFHWKQKKLIPFSQIHYKTIFINIIFYKIKLKNSVLRINGDKIWTLVKLIFNFFFWIKYFIIYTIPFWLITLIDLNFKLLEFITNKLLFINVLINSTICKNGCFKISLMKNIL